MHYFALFVPFSYFLPRLVEKSRIVKESTNPYYLLTTSRLLFDFPQLFIDYFSLLVDRNFLALLSTICGYSSLCLVTCRESDNPFRILSTSQND